MIQVRYTCSAEHKHCVYVVLFVMAALKNHMLAASDSEDCTIICCGVHTNFVGTAINRQCANLGDIKQILFTKTMLISHVTCYLNFHIVICVDFKVTGISTFRHRVSAALGDFFSFKRQGFLRLRTYAIAILRFCARLRRKRAHWQNRQHHAHRKCCTEKSRTLFSHVLFPFSFVILQAPTPKGTVCILSLPPPHTTYQEAFC